MPEERWCDDSRSRKWKCASPITTFDCDRKQIRKQMVIARPKNEKLVPRSVCPIRTRLSIAIKFESISVGWVCATPGFIILIDLCTSSRALQSLKSKMSLMRAHYAWQRQHTENKLILRRRRMAWLSVSTRRWYAARRLTRCT